MAAAAQSDTADPTDTASATWQRSILCRYYAAGRCRAQNNCAFSHDLDLTQTINTSFTSCDSHDDSSSVVDTESEASGICRYFQQGQCAFGDNCRFVHASPDTLSAPEEQLEPGPYLDFPDLVSEPFIFDGISASGAAVHIELYPADVAHPGLNGVPVDTAPFVSAASRPRPSPISHPSLPSTSHPALPSASHPALPLDSQASLPGARRPPLQLDANTQDEYHFEALRKSVASQQKANPRTRLSSWVDAPEFVPRVMQHQEQTASRPDLGQPTRTKAHSIPVVSVATVMARHGDDDDEEEESASRDRPSYDSYESCEDGATLAVDGDSGETAVASRTWAQVVGPPQNSSTAYTCGSVAEAESQLCPFGLMGECRYGENCLYVHGEICDMCAKAALHPFHQEQRKAHQTSCLQGHEEAMERAFAAAKSKEKTCGICMEVVVNKPKGEARFGILPNCNHCFCLDCLRKWRQVRQFENQVIRACPECRQTSDYICPSRYWVDTREEKEKLFADYKVALNKKECKYFKRGEGECPFGNKCFYRHADAEGMTIDVGPPSRRTRRTNADGELTLVSRLLMYDFLEAREGRVFNFLELLELLSDDEDEELEIELM